MSTRKGWILAGLLALAAIFVAVAWVQVDPFSAEEPAPPGLSRELRAAVTPDGVLAHAQRFQEIAAANGGSRAAGSPGYDASAEYVATSSATPATT